MIQVRAIILEDSEDDLLLTLKALKNGGIDVIFKCVQTEEGFKSALENEQWQLILSDYCMPCFSALEALAMFKKSGRDLPFIIVSGSICEEVVLEAKKAGAHDLVSKHNLSKLPSAVIYQLVEAEKRAVERFRNTPNFPT